MGTLTCRSKVERDSLLQELNTLKHILISLSVENQACVIASLVRTLHSDFARIDISPGQGRMSQDNENAGIMDLKKNQASL